MLMSALDKLRIDKWLWVARIYKTRSAAATAVSGGKVHVNQQRVKSSHPVKRGDIVQFRKEIYEFELQVVAMTERRGPAKVAQTLYIETESSIAKRDSMRELNRLNAVYFDSGLKRPDKKQRRQLIRLRQKNNDSQS